MTIRASAMGAREWGMLLALSLAWGGSFFFNAVALRELPPLTLVWLRVAVAAATLLVAMRVLGRPMPRRRATWAAFAAMGMLNNAVPFVLIVWGQHRIASGLASILNATTPLFTVLVAHVLTPDEKLTTRKAGGVALGFAGAAVMVGAFARGEPGTPGQSGMRPPRSRASPLRSPMPSPGSSAAGSAAWPCRRSRRPPDR